ncbi:MAG TPA: M48 family metalloprotease [Steroidobacteraceae bacterium]|nr:M48 family metalloprotease [Steroidobacteraceae bacterium]
MRRLFLLLLTAATGIATVASAVEPIQPPPLSVIDAAPPPTPLANDLPSQVMNELPDMGSPEQTIISHTEERQLGYSIVQQLRDQNALLEDPEISEYVNSIGDRLAAQSPDGAEGFQFFVVKDSAINAFAVPGGFVFINYGLILATDTESELASVLGHEIAHVTQHHIARSIRAQSQQSITTMAAMLAAILLGAVGHGGGQAIEGGIAAAQGLAVQQQINFTRDEEAEADRVGIGYLAGAGFDTQAMGNFFEVLSRKEGLAATYIPAMLVDHPVTTDRIAEARARAAQFPPRKAKDSLSYALVRERVRVLTAPGDTDIEKVYAARLAQGQNDMATRYGEALALMADNRPVEAQKILFELTKEHEGLIMLHSALGQAEVKAGQTNDALGTFKHAVKLFPRNVPVTVRYAESLIAAGNAKEAHAVLLDLFNNVPPTPEQIRLTANAASAAGDTGDAYYYMGEYQLAGGNLPLAATQYQLALSCSNLTQIQRQRYQARLDEVREYLATAKLRKTSMAGP